MLQAGSCHGELQCQLLVLIGGQTIDQAASKGVAATDTIDNIADLILFGHVEVLTIIQASSPSVPVCAMAFPQRDGNHLHVWICLQNLAAQRLVLLAIQLTGFHIDIHRDLQRLLNIFLIGDGYIHKVCQFPHNLCCLLAILPQILTIVQIAGNRDTALLGFFHSFQRQLHGAFGNGRGDAGNMEPIDAFISPTPVNVARLSQRDGGIRTVIDDLAGQLVCAAFQIVDAHAAIAANDPK